MNSMTNFYMTYCAVLKWKKTIVLSICSQIKATRHLVFMCKMCKKNAENTKYFKSETFFLRATEITPTLT